MLRPKHASHGGGINLELAERDTIHSGQKLKIGCAWIELAQSVKPLLDIFGTVDRSLEFRSGNDLFTASLAAAEEVDDFVVRKFVLRYVRCVMSHDLTKFVDEFRSFHK